MAILNDLIEKRTNMIAEYRKVNDVFQQSKTEEDKVKRENLYKEIEDLDIQIERESKIEKVESLTAQFVEAVEKQSVDEGVDLTEAFVRTLKEATSTAAVTIPTTIASDVLNNLLGTSVIRKIASVKRIGNKESFPMRPDVAAGAFVPEGTAPTAEGLTYSAVNLTAKRLVKELTFAESEFAGSTLDLVAEIRALMTEAFLKNDENFISGSGSSTVPYSLFEDITQSSTSSVVGSLNFNDLITLQDDVDPKYHNGACYLANTGIKTTIRTTVDSNGNYIVPKDWDEKTLLGKPIYFSSYVPTTAPLLFGNGKYYCIGDRTDMDIKPIIDGDDQRKSLRSYLATMWTDGKLAIPAAWTKLVLAT